MKSLLALPALALLASLAAPAMADPVTVTKSREGPRFEGSTTVTRDREAGTSVRDTEVTRLRDGATRSSHVERERIAGGFRAEGTRTNFRGGTTTFNRSHTGPRRTRRGR